MKPTLFLLSIIFIFFSCKKNNPVPFKETPEVPDQASFSVVKVDYSLSKGEGLDSTLHHLESYKLQNSSNIQVEQTYFEDFQGLNKQSLFTFKHVPSDLPTTLKISTLDIPTPTQIELQHIDAVNLGWKMTDTLQQKPYDYLKPSKQVVKIPAKSLIQIDRSIKEYRAKVSFSATIKNENTGVLHVVTGKWNGTLYFSSYTVVLSQNALR